MAETSRLEHLALHAMSFRSRAPKAQISRSNLNPRNTLQNIPKPISRKQFHRGLNTQNILRMVVRYMIAYVYSGTLIRTN